MRSTPTAAIAALLLTLSACGSSGSSSDPPKDPPPDTASAEDTSGPTDTPPPDDTATPPTDSPAPTDNGTPRTDDAPRGQELPPIEDTKPQDEPPEPLCVPLEKFCVEEDVFICKADGFDFDFVKTCPEDTLCQDGTCGCKPTCEDDACGDDGCGGLCNGCLVLGFDDGTTETAMGYNSEPDFLPEKLACLVRYELPQEGMLLTEFTAGWMYGLFNLAVPFDLVYAAGPDVNCQAGDEDDWYLEFCGTTPDKLVVIAPGMTPKEPYTPIPTEELGEVVLPAKTMFIGALFTITEYPWFVCPVDQQGKGTHSFMMPQYAESEGEVVLKAAAFERSDEDLGAIPFTIQVTLPPPE